MKKILLMAAVMLCIGTAYAAADDVDAVLTDPATVSLQTHTREMIRAGINEDTSLRMTRAMQTQRIREENIIQAQKIIMQAQKAGLPTEPVMTKAFEGMTKQANTRQILQAMETVRSRYEFAYGQANMLMSDQNRTQRLGDQIADCLAAGMKKTDIEAIRSCVQQRTRNAVASESNQLTNQTFQAVRTLSRLGVCSETTTRAVSQALDKGFSAQEMVQMRRAFTVQAKHQHPEQLGKKFAEDITAGRQANHLGKASHSACSTGGGNNGGGSNDWCRWQ